MNRITMCLEHNTGGRVLAEFNLEDFAEKIRSDERKKIMEMLDNSLDKEEGLNKITQYLIKNELGKPKDFNDCEQSYLQSAT